MHFLATYWWLFLVLSFALAFISAFLGYREYARFRNKVMGHIGQNFGSSPKVATLLSAKAQLHAEEPQPLEKDLEEMTSFSLLRSTPIVVCVLADSACFILFCVGVAANLMGK